MTELNLVTDLRNYRITSESVFVNGYYNVGDNGGGHFVWDQNNNEDDNGGTIIKVNDINSGRWVRRYEEKVNVLWFGAKGDDSLGSESINTEAFTKCFNTATLNANIYIPPLTYRIGEVIINSRSFSLEQYDATFKLIGDKAGFRFIGNTNGVKICGGFILGDNINRDNDTSKMQFGYRFGIENNANAQRCILEDVYIESTNLGVAFANGTGSTTPSKDHKVINCIAKNIRGTVGGVGYGFQFSQANGSTIVGCTVDNCGRHGIYFAEGENYSAVNCIIKNHRITEGVIGSPRAGLDISRSTNVCVSNCIFYHNRVSAMIFNDALGEAGMKTKLENVILEGCTFNYDLEQAIFVGYGTPDESNTIDNVSINNNIFNSNIKDAGVNDSDTIFISYGKNILLSGNLISTTKSNCISTHAIGNSNFSNNINIKNNVLTSNLHPIVIGSTASLEEKKIDIKDNILTNSSDGDEIRFAGINNESEITNPKLIFKRTNGKNSKKRISNLTDKIIVSGCDSITFSQPTLVTISQFIGGSEGDVINCWFTNENTIIPASKFYLEQGQGDYRSKQKGLLSLIFIDGAWREICRKDTD